MLTQITEHKLEEEPTAINDIVLPANIGWAKNQQNVTYKERIHTESNRINVLIENEREGYREIEDGETLGTDGEGQNFNGIEDNKWAKSNTADMSALRIQQER